MTNATRRLILRADSIFLLLFGGSGFLLDLRGYFTGVGAQARLTANAPHTMVGFVEAHGLAVIIGVLLWRASAQPSRAWHFTGAAVHTLLGASNLIFWQIFVAADLLKMGYVSTGFHILFVLLHLWAAVAAPREAKVLGVSHA